MNRFHGVTSLFLICASIGIVFFGIYRFSSGFAWAYALVVGAGMVLLLFSYCAKCPCRDGKCSHVLPGLATRLLPKRKTASYTTIDYTGLIIPLTVIFLYPQYWLIKTPSLLAAFWIIAAVAIIEISTCICTKCENTNCPLCRSEAKKLNE